MSVINNEVVSQSASLEPGVEGILTAHIGGTALELAALHPTAVTKPQLVEYGVQHGLIPRVIANDWRSFVEIHFKKTGQMPSMTPEREAVLGNLPLAMPGYEDLAGQPWQDWHPRIYTGMVDLASLCGVIKALKPAADVGSYERRCAAFNNLSDGSIYNATYSRLKLYVAGLYFSTET